MERIHHPTGFLRLKEVLKIFPISRSSWYRGIEQGRYPEPVKVGRLSFWRVEHIQALCDFFAGHLLAYPSFSTVGNPCEVPMLDLNFDN